MPRRSDPEYYDTIDELMKSGKEQDPRKGFERVEKAEPEPGSDAYLRRRQREGEEDLRNAPRRPR